MFTVKKTATLGVAFMALVLTGACKKEKPATTPVCDVKTAADALTLLQKDAGAKTWVAVSYKEKATDKDFVTVDKGATLVETLHFGAAGTKTVTRKFKAAGTTTAIIGTNTFVDPKPVASKACEFTLKLEAKDKEGKANGDYTITFAGTAAVPEMTVVAPGDGTAAAPKFVVYELLANAAAAKAVAAYAVADLVAELKFDGTFNATHTGTKANEIDAAVGKKVKLALHFKGESGADNGLGITYAADQTADVTQANARADAKYTVELSTTGTRIGSTITLSDVKEGAIKNNLTAKMQPSLTNTVFTIRGYTESRTGVELVLEASTPGGYLVDVPETGSKFIKLGAVAKQQ